MKLYFFESTECENCKLLHEVISSIDNKLQKLGINDIIYVDANADNTQDFCDKHNVDMIPHIKIFNDNGICIFNEVGIFDVNLIKTAIDKSKKTIFDINKKN